MSDKLRGKHILERWTVGIKREDKKHENMPAIFESLAGQLFAAGIEFETAYDLMKTSAKLMYPVPEVIKRVYASNPMKKFQTLMEFTKSWHESLDKSAIVAFYGYYDIEGSDPTKIPPSKKISPVKQEDEGGIVSDDELNQEDFWKSTKSVKRDRPWLFDDEDQAQ